LAITLLKRVGLVLITLAALPYAWGPIYQFPDPVVFSGPHLLNPYAGGTGIWQRANLHAHGRAWGGLTNGRQPAEEVVQRYQALGYSVSGVSDYESIAAHRGVPTIPIYEHGYNIGKVHQLAIGAREVDWVDFLFWQSKSHQQYVIDRLRESTDLVAIAHPSIRDAYVSDDLRQLTGYQLMEVINGPFAVDDLWDAALSSGHVVWALANDDTHDLDDLRRTAAAWTMIDAPTPSTSDVVGALRAGRSYAVSRVGDKPVTMDTRLASVEAHEGRVVVHVTGQPSRFAFIGQNGVVRRTIEHVTSAEYTFEPDDTYIRTIINSSRTTLYLNPVLRYDGVRAPAPAASVNYTSTWLLRGSSALAAVSLVLLWRRRRTPVLTAHRAALPGPDRNPA
jgi:hypothetical protein